MKSIAYIPGSDGAANASLMTITAVRSSGATTIQTNTVANVPTKFYASMGTPHTFTDPVTGETITVVSEATAVDFAGRVDGSNIEIVEIAPGYADNGSAVGDIIMIRPVTEWANNIHNLVAESHNDDGTLKEASVLNALTAKGVLGDIEYFNASGTWTKPADIKFVIVEMVGGGGAGGSTGATAAGQGACSGAGGSGAYARKKILAADLAASVTVTVGAAGAAGAAGNVAGGTGGTSSFGAHASCTGGAGGTGSGSSGSNASLSGGAGGTATGGDLNVNGGHGNHGFIYAGQWLPTPTGGSSRLGSGGVTNQSAVGYGGGGGGLGKSQSLAAAAGNPGGAGIVIVYEYY